MKKLIVLISISILSQAFPVMAKEGAMCDYYYNNVQRKEKLIRNYGPTLSSMAKEKLFGGLNNDTKGCVGDCEGHKFKYCNDIAKWISK